MIITKRDMLVLQALARYHILNRGQAQKLLFPRDKDGCVTRRRLAALAKAGLIRRHSALVASSYDGAPAPVYILGPKGREHLVGATGDDRFLHKPVHLPHPLHLRHHMAIAELHMLLDAAIAEQTEIILEDWFNETDVVNADDSDPSQHYRLFTKFEGDPVVSCAPDAGFLLNRAGRRAAFYLELERGEGSRGTGARQLADRKPPGYAELALGHLYLKHFPAADDEFGVLLVVPNSQRRETVRRAFQKKDPATFRTDLWRFAALTDLTVETFLRGEVFYRCEDQAPEPLLAGARVSTPGTTTRSGERGG
jgi:hypothetical protein